MGKGMRVTSSEFQQNVGRYQDAAEQSPVAITKNGRVHTVLMSAAHFELITSGRIARKIEDADEETIRAIGRSEVSSDHAASIAFSKTGRRDAASARGGPCHSLILSLGRSAGERRRTRTQEPSLRRHP